MDILLKNDFTKFNALPPCVLDIKISTTLTYFEVEDVHRSTVINTVVGSGTAKYRNSNAENVVIIDYDRFLTSLPFSFQKGKERCDIIVYTINNSHFILNELKDRYPKNKVLTKATSQLLASLNEIIRIPSIELFINKFIERKCCYSNKQPVAPSLNLNATSAFNRLNTLSQNGFKLSHPQIESLGFELYEYSGNQIIILS